MGGPCTILPRISTNKSPNILPTTCNICSILGFVCVFVCGVVLFFIFITHGSTYDVVHDCYGCMYHNHATTTDLHT